MAKKDAAIAASSASGRRPLRRQLAKLGPRLDGQAVGRNVRNPELDQSRGFRGGDLGRLVDTAYIRSAHTRGVPARTAPVTAAIASSGVWIRPKKPQPRFFERLHADAQAVHPDVDQRPRSLLVERAGVAFEA